MKGKVGKAAVVVLGAGAAAVGFALQLTTASYGSFLWVLSAVLIGLGCGAFGHGLGDLLSQRALKDAPELARRLEIEATDERNVALANAAKAKAFDQMLYIFGALMLAFVLMQIELAAILLLVAAYLFIVGRSIYYRSKYEKEM